ncbi:MAG: lipid-A-disaccharide synthase [Thermoguttaceae bacterium]|jgi:lipid-A-disaccharide synthase
MKRPLFYLSAGEPSGDQHAAGLIRELKKRFPDAEFVGFGGPETEKAGCRVEVDLTQFAVMWFLRALVNIPFFLRCLKKAREFFRREKPDILILVDYPGFNFRLAKYAKAEGIPVCFFVPPQIWAWAQGRIKKMRRYVDFVISPLPFEQKWFAAHGVETVAVPHPFFEEMKSRSFDLDFLTRLVGESAADCMKSYPAYEPEPLPPSPILTILPGSRSQEIAANLPEMLRTAGYVREAVPGVRPIIAAFRDEQVATIRTVLDRENVSIPVYAGHTRELIAAGTCALAVSGSVSIELLALAKPTVVYYRIGRFEHWLSRFFRRVRFISLVNLLAADATEGESIFYKTRRAPALPTQKDWNLMLFPEFLTGRDRSKEASLPLTTWLTDPAELSARRSALARLFARVSAGESSFKLAADAIAERLE